ncbi:hypothetical protein D8B26_000164 [Coccidioides posadasii str. Silveira]|uniref:Predicted protein n=1 Tax=Coccidioides posadasii (strain RMSCC 757 / Silveira) TaxID=443226 RepID=E9D7S8_COCPS|nr:predicted protein [Coccidioides posadasii str. Silveira]QVM05455.1 hypothetical protein D8B26_000164 [Coccidioides posadasii str. Silveira]TPX21896.1 hypothetical protein DIZ76_015861 [Coccidioides immitis]
MNPNYTILVVLLTIPILAFMAWRGGFHIVRVVAHGVQMRKHEQEIRRLEAARVEREVQLAAQVRDLTTQIAKHRADQEGQQTTEGTSNK